MTHICVGKLSILASDNGLSPGRRQAIIWTNAGILLIGPLGTNFSEILIEINYIFIQENAFENVVWKMAAICLGLNVLTHSGLVLPYGSTDVGQHWLSWWLTAWPSHYWNQCWLIVRDVLWHSPENKFTWTGYSIICVRKLHVWNYYHISRGQFVKL